jgi:hypothetical protein
MNAPDQVQPARATESVRKVLGATVPEVRFGKLLEPDTADRHPTFEKGARHAMHAVHHASIRPEDDRIRRIDCQYQSNVIDDVTDRWPIRPVEEPVLGVDLGYCVEADLDDREVSTQLDQTMDVPSVETRLAHLEVVLNAHRSSLVAKGERGPSFGATHPE